MSAPIICTRVVGSGNVSTRVEAEAVQWDGTYADQARIVTWGSPYITGWFDGRYFLDVEHRGRVLRCDPTDWIVRERGGFNVLSDREFHARYDIA